MFKMGAERDLYEFLLSQNISEENPLIATDTEIGEKIGVARTTISLYKRILSGLGLIKYQKVYDGRVECAYTYVLPPQEPEIDIETFERDANI